MASRFVSFTLEQFQESMDVVGAKPVTLVGTGEYVFERPFRQSDGMEGGRFALRIYSTINLNTGIARECGEDAIRVLIYDKKLDRNTYVIAVNRTKNALKTVIERAREVWAYKNDHLCSHCGAIMLIRQRKNGGKFLGCTAYPVCKSVRSITA